MSFKTNMSGIHSFKSYVTRQLIKPADKEQQTDRQKRATKEPLHWCHPGEHFRARGYFVSIVWLDERMVRAYIRNQEDERYDQMKLEIG